MTPLVCVPVAHAQGDDADSLRQEVGELKRTVERLDAKLQHLEQQPTPSPQGPAAESIGAATSASATATPTTEASARQRWRQIEYGMSTSDISALLGPPQRIMEMSPKLIWYYSYPESGNASVVFTDAGGVIDWQAPATNAFW